MELGIIGLGRMGNNMAKRLIKAGHTVVAYDPIKEAVDAVVEEGAVGALSIQELVQKTTKPRAILVMIPSGEPTESVINTLATVLSKGDIIIDGGNSNYKDSIRRAAALAKKQIILLDVGTSGGIWGFQDGYCLMIGGDIEAFQRLEPVFLSLAPSPKHGYGHVGPSGAGHFVKMIHNGIEYGLMQSYAEGFELLQAKQEFDLNLPQIAEIWRYGSVVRSWLLDLAAATLQEDPNLADIEGYVEDLGEGKWTVQESLELNIPIPVITQSLQVRYRSRQEKSFSNKLLAALRKQFGGHSVRKANP